MPRSIFQPQVVNGPFEDPVVYLDFLFRRRALLFDMGNLRRLAPRKLLRISDVFVSHTHMDHFNDFDWLIRITLGRDLHLRLFGPPGFIDRVDHRLQGYTWNLVENYATDVTLEVTELHPGERGRRAVFRCRERFRRRDETAIDLPGNVLRDEPGLRVTGTLLDHGVPCLAVAVQEKRHVNIWKNRLAELGLGPGPWLADLKDAIHEDRPDTTPVRAEWSDDNGRHRRHLTLAELRPVVEITPGQRIAWIVDAAPTAGNETRIVELLRDAHVAFIEACFLHADAARAADRSHLTARRAGELARAAGVERLVPIHFSPRYSGEAARLEAEAQAAFAGRAADAGG